MSIVSQAVPDRTAVPEWKHFEIGYVESISGSVLQGRDKTLEDANQEAIREARQHVELGGYVAPHVLFANGDLATIVVPPLDPAKPCLVLYVDAAEPDPCAIDSACERFLEEGPGGPASELLTRLAFEAIGCSTDLEDGGRWAAFGVETARYIMWLAPEGLGGALDYSRAVTTVIPRASVVRLA
jgi:hypothetical protein